MKRMIKTRHLARGLRFVLTALVISACLFSTNSFGGKKKMEPLYNINEAQSLKPQEFQLNSGLFGTDLFASVSSNISLFPVPQDNAVGTNDMNNAITLISFHKDHINFDKYFKNAVDGIRGGGVYMPLVSKDVIGLGQVRRFMIYDFKKKIHRKFRIAMSIGKTIEKVATADARQRHFIFEIEGHSGKSPDPWDTASTLQLMDLSGEEPKLIKEIPIGKGVMWSVVGDKNFLWDFDDKKPNLQVFNMNLEPAHHPLADVINQNKGKISLIVINAHPTLPFAILSGGKEGATFIYWGADRDKIPHLLISDANVFSFSPDGKWVAFQEGSSTDAKTYLMPVSEKYPHYLGSPIQIFNKYFNDDNFAWTNNPISFVGSRGEIIYRWELTNQAHPESKKATFHDYIVDRDLEKLTREKRQGLRGKHK